MSADVSERLHACCLLFRPRSAIPLDGSAHSSGATCTTGTIKKNGLTPKIASNGGSRKPARRSVRAAQTLPPGRDPRVRLNTAEEVSKEQQPLTAGLKRRTVKVCVLRSLAPPRRCGSTIHLRAVFPVPAEGATTQNSTPTESFVRFAAHIRAALETASRRGSSSTRGLLAPPLHGATAETAAKPS